MTIGIIGVGRMGLAMAKHLLGRGFAVTAFDVSAEAIAAARDLGADVAVSPEALGASARFVIVAVGYDEEAILASLGPHGCLASMEPGSVVAVSSTVSPATIDRIGRAAAERGVGILDAPICRGRFFADAGELLAFFGGDADAVGLGRPVYECFCSDIEVVGPAGAGQVAKAINNMMLWITSVGLIEAGRIAEARGLDLPRLRDGLMKSSAKSQALEDWNQTSFTWALKDMQIVSELADGAGLSLPLTGAVREMVKDARRIKAENPPPWTR